MKSLVCNEAEKAVFIFAAKASWRPSWIL